MSRKKKSLCEKGKYSLLGESIPTYSAGCEICGTKHTYFSKIDNRNITPVCCGVATKRLLDTPMIQAQTVSDIIHCSDGTKHEGRNAFEAHMRKNGLIPGSDVESEANYRAAETQKTVDKERRADIEKIATTLGD